LTFLLPVGNHDVSGMLVLQLGPFNYPKDAKVGEKRRKTAKRWTGPGDSQVALVPKCLGAEVSRAPSPIGTSAEVFGQFQTSDPRLFR